VIRAGLLRCLAVAAVLAAVGCGKRYAPFAENQVGVAQAIASRMLVPQLLDRVEAICQARQTDPGRDVYQHKCGYSGDCSYSRTATADLLRQWWTASGQPSPLVEQTRDDGGFRTTNLWLDFPGSLRPDERVLAVAHYDAWFCGANDNATGTAMLFEVALALAGTPLERSVRILWVDGEEFGMVGSTRYLQASGHDGVVMVLNADMVAFVGGQDSSLTRGPGSTEYWVQANEESAGAAYQFADLGARLPEPVDARALVYPGNGASLAGVVFGYSLSDQGPFWLEGIPALFPFPTGDIPNWYHTPNDLPNQVDPDRLQRSARWWAAGLAAFATEAR
jgi:hypothetical protein